MLVKQVLKNIPTNIPQWEKDFIDERLTMVQQHPERLQPIEMLFEAL